MGLQVAFLGWMKARSKKVPSGEGVFFGGEMATDTRRVSVASLRIEMCYAYELGNSNFGKQQGAYQAPKRAVFALYGLRLCLRFGLNARASLPEGFWTQVLALGIVPVNIPYLTLSV